MERPDAWRTRDPNGFAAHGRPTLAVLAQLGFLARRRQCLRAGVWPQHVEQSEGEECSAEAGRELLRVRSSRACRRGSVITSDRQHIHLRSGLPKGELGSRSGSFDHRRVPGPTTVGSAAGPDRRLPAQENIAAPVKERRRESASLRGISDRHRGSRRARRGPRETGRAATFRTPRRAGRAGDQSGSWSFRR